MKVEELKEYEVLEQRRVEDLDSYGYLLKHKKSGARIQLLSNEDDNKVFFIGFRTPPADSTGVAHIIEHTVLCGSDKYPVKDPFIEMAKGSLNTFLNAMTYPDKTVYPVASCNDKDFQNLMDVYLDAVFHPNIYKTKKIFEQEGWHYELEDEGSDMTINGVVYNEMKGAFSSPDDVLSREVLNSLFPDTTYSIESGGDPEVIPELTYEQYLDFHRKYYHPSNSYIYLYGDMDMVEKLEYLDREYLSKYDEISVDSQVGIQSGFETSTEVVKQYSISENESEKQNTYLSYNVVVGDNLDRERYIAFDMLDYALCSAPGAPIKVALIDQKIGKDIYSSYDSSVMQPYFSIVAKGAEEQDKDRFVEIIEEIFKDQVKNGINKNALYGALNRFEFTFREADFGSYPKGLMLGLQSLDSWLYDETKPWIHIEANDTFVKLRTGIENGYFEKLIEECLINNTHKSIVLLTPSKGLTAKKEDALKKKLADYKTSLSKEEIAAIVEETRALKEYQEAPDREEDIEKIPLLTREDMKKEASLHINEAEEVSGTTVLTHPIFTNGISYIRLMFDISRIPQEYIPYLSIYKNVLGMMDTEHYSYGELFHEINKETGGIAPAINTYTMIADPNDVKKYFEVKIKTLSHAKGKGFELTKEMLLHTKYDDKKRLLELMDEALSRMEEILVSSGHSTAMLRALSGVSKSAAFGESQSGISAYHSLKYFKECVEKDIPLFAYKKANDVLQDLSRMIFRTENLFVDYTGTKEEYTDVPALIEELKKDLFTQECAKGSFDIERAVSKEGFSCASQVQYVCRAGNFHTKGLPYTGALRVLKVMMGYEYLWMNVRVKGGAYGCMCGFTRSGDSYFVSYRDPHIENTIEVFENAADFIENYEADERTMTQYIIGAISDLDVPKTPSQKGTISLNAYLTGLTNAMVQQARDELLATDADTLRGLSKYVRAFMQDQALCVVGAEEHIKESSALFDEVQPLIG